MPAWRLVGARPDGPPAGEGAWQMALDAALLEAHARGEAPATLRFYRWSVPTVSLGQAQRPVRAELEAWRAAGFQVVRRPTGGRAVLHAGELTYAVVASPAWGVPGGVVESYRRVTEALAGGLRRLGVEAALVAGEQASRDPRYGAPACFSAGTRADLLAEGRKLLGSAQRRIAGGWLQHGSLRLTPLEGTEDPTGLTAGAIALSELLPGSAGPGRIAHALAEGLAEGLGVQLVEAELAASELRAADGAAARFHVPLTGDI